MFAIQTQVSTHNCDQQAPWQIADSAASTYRRLGMARNIEGEALRDLDRVASEDPWNSDGQSGGQGVGDVP